VSTSAADPRRATACGPQLVQPDAVRVKEPRDVVVGRDEERRRVRKGLVVEQQPGIDGPWGTMTGSSRTAS
jgi:hypothetical protein